MNKLIYRLILSEIEPYSKVLDLGCGNGELLHQLKTQKNIEGYGIDKDFDNISSCIKKGISVFQGNINEGLREFQDQSYDYVILSQTLQEVYDPKYVLSEILRVGKKGIITFPNFGYWKIRFQMLVSGFSPKTKTLPYEWYNTPNIRVITINDFRNLCKDLCIKIIKEIPLFEAAIIRKSFPLFLTNLISQKGTFVLSSEQSKDK